MTKNFVIIFAPSCCKFIANFWLRPPNRKIIRLQSFRLFGAVDFILHQNRVHIRNQLPYLPLETFFNYFKVWFLSGLNFRVGSLRLSICAFLTFSEKWIFFIFFWGKLELFLFWVWLYFPIIFPFIF